MRLKPEIIHARLEIEVPNGFALVAMPDGLLTYVHDSKYEIPANTDSARFRDGGQGWRIVGITMNLLCADARAA